MLNVVQESTSPPPYYSSDPSSSSSTPAFVPPDSVKPSNYLFLSRSHASLVGTYVIDPSLEIPSDFLVPLPEGESEETRRNLYAKTTHASATVDLYLLDKPLPKSQGKVLLTTSSAHGNVYTYIHRADSSPAFSLKSSTKHAFLLVKIPRSFRGIVTGNVAHGRFWMSEAVSAQATIFSEVEGIKRVFLGDLSARNDETDDSMELANVHGNISIYFEDEDTTPAAVKSLKGFWKRITG
jgi:hypothetical protein